MSFIFLAYIVVAILLGLWAWETQVLHREPSRPWVENAAILFVIVTVLGFAVR